MAGIGFKLPTAPHEENDFRPSAQTGPRTWLPAVLLWLVSMGAAALLHRLIGGIDLKATILSYLTVIPAALFIIFPFKSRVYGKYIRMYGTLVSGGTLDMIGQAKAQLAQTVLRETLRLVIVQGALTAIALLASDTWPGWIRQPGVVSASLRLYAPEAAINVMLLLCILVMHLFRDRRGALAAAIVFIVLHAGISAIPLAFGRHGFDIGGWSASLLAVIWSGSKLWAYLKRIERHILFMADAGRR
ncbi:exopolysaccharide Pel transporter PelG [Paenibacillus hamazuiensis]|uniref:exopolysaccharide Pel transporter PelG n=1 Tax=Paenibacillus hamazuiensis TaxID=2936508 RepID=UPI00200DE799|nr:exopolysaccharide Pel transporter PelG [Paenibacillus hamazuiensis]